MEEEFKLTGRSFRDRGRRTDELIEVVRKLFTGKMVEHHGEFYDFDPVQMAPVPSRFPPLLVGGHSPAALRRAAQSDGWLGVNYELAQAFEILSALQSERAAAGRSDRPFDVGLSLNAPPAHAELDRLRDAGVTMLVNPPLIGPLGEWTELEQKRDSLKTFAARYIEPLRV